MFLFGILSLADPGIPTTLCTSPKQQNCLSCPPHAVCSPCQDDSKCGRHAELPGNFICVNETFRIYKTCARQTGIFLHLNPSEITSDKIYTWQKAIYDIVVENTSVPIEDVLAKFKNSAVDDFRGLTAENVEDIWVYERDRYSIEGDSLVPWPKQPLHGKSRWCAAICSTVFIASLFLLPAIRF
jgi:hypothetical protein